jgi:putative ABC transport system permease protein
MNIMLVTVTERTREIGIRKSLGARNFDIRRQFIIEAVVLTGIGGLIGILLGWSIAAIADLIISNFLKTFAPAFSATSIITAFTISSLIGIIFGVYPANKAAMLDPIEALRYE